MTHSSMMSMWSFDIANDEQIAYIKEETRRINELLKDWFVINWSSFDWLQIEFGFDMNGKIILADEFLQITAAFGDVKCTIWTRMFSVGPVAWWCLWLYWKLQDWSIFGMKTSVFSITCLNRNKGNKMINRIFVEKKADFRVKSTLFSKRTAV